MVEIQAFLEQYFEAEIKQFALNRDWTSFL